MTTEYFLFRNKEIVFNGNFPPRPVTEDEFTTFFSSLSALSLPLHNKPNGQIAVELAPDLALPTGYITTNLRTLVGALDEPSFRIWGRASHLLHWNGEGRFCGFCGHETSWHPSEMARECPQCKSVSYPPVSPCIIVLISKGHEILLARSPHFPQGRYSTLAGFIEPGESAEEALHREVFEEVGIKVKDLRYFTSQPWPFPHQLMLGFFAEHDSGEITIDGKEICDANWYAFNDLPDIPDSATIAGQLIRTFCAKINAPDMKEEAS